MPESNMQAYKNRLQTLCFAGGKLLHSKRPPFRGQEAAFYSLKDGLLERKR